MIINKLDNVEINLHDGHKYALKDIGKGESIIKYGYPIGLATEDIRAGEYVHTHNVVTNLPDTSDYEYVYRDYGIAKNPTKQTFLGYRRKNGSVGIRNEVWIVNTVGCVNKVAEKLAKITGAKHFSHPYGCSQLGDDGLRTQLILRGLVNHPNAAGVLVLGLGCESNGIEEFKSILGEYDEDRVKFLNCRGCQDEISEGVKLINELFEYAESFKRTPINISELKFGLVCGGNDMYSAVSANPLVGELSDRMISHGSSCVLTEIPEMFGAEPFLLERCETKRLFKKILNLINKFKDSCYENLSAEDICGEISTLEEKSLGRIQKAGHAKIVAVLDYGQTIKKNGLQILNGPANDMMAITNLASVGVHMILFTTGKGTPIGGPVPTVKISSNKDLASEKRNWIDFDASPVLSGETLEDMTEVLLEFILDVASGKETKNETFGYREISIFKDGVTL